MEKEGRRDTFLGIGAGGLTLLISLIFLAVTRYVFTDFSVLWEWYWILIPIVLGVIMVVLSFFVKGFVSLGANGFLFLVSMVMVFFSWYMGSSRVVVFGSGEDITELMTKNVQSGAGTNVAALTPLFKKHNIVFVCVGKKDKSVSGDAEASKWEASKLVEAFNKAETAKATDGADYSTEQIDNSKFAVVGKKSAEEFKKALANMRFTGKYKKGIVDFSSPVGSWMEDSDGITLEKMETDYIKGLKA